MLYVGIDGKSETDPNGPTARPDYKLNWKVVDLQESAIRSELEIQRSMQLGRGSSSNLDYMTD